MIENDGDIGLIFFVVICFTLLFSGFILGHNIGEDSIEVYEVDCTGNGDVDLVEGYSNMEFTRSPISRATEDCFESGAYSNNAWDDIVKVEIERIDGLQGDS